MTGKQKRFLRALAHPLKPVVRIGKLGLSAETMQQIESQLLDHEPIKVKVLESSPEDHGQCVSRLEGEKGMEVIQSIGKTLVLYRRHPKKPVIQIPG